MRYSVTEHRSIDMMAARMAAIEYICVKTYPLFTKMLTVNRVFTLIDVEIYRISWYNKFISVRIRTGGTNMAVSYKRLWHLLLDRDMKKKDLIELAHISDYTIRKLNRGDNVTTDVLVKICRALDCSLDDIVEILPEDK